MASILPGLFHHEVKKRKKTEKGLLCVSPVFFFVLFVGFVVKSKSAQ